MIKFLRKIRHRLFIENKLSKYLLYAIGEILLVVIGILIALQINNWNEGIKKANQEKELYSQLIADLISEGTTIEKAIDRAKEYEDLHYHLFDARNGLAEYDSTMKYGLLRYNIPFSPTFKGNNQIIVDKLSKKSVRDAINAYFNAEKEAEYQNEDFYRFKEGRVRPYLIAHHINKPDVVYNQTKYQKVDPKRTVDYQELSKQFGTDEFDGILFELKVKTVNVILRLETLKDRNAELRKTLQDELKNKSIVKKDMLAQ